MFKKIALAAALTATASFATWDYFPVQEAGKGQVELNNAVLMQDKSTALMDVVAARYTIVQNLEAGLAIPFLTNEWYDGKSVDKAGGLMQIELMLRYQFMPIMNAFLDVDFPTCGDHACYDDNAFVFHFGVQYSQKFGMVDFGSELGLQLSSPGDDKTTPPWLLNLGLEADFAVNETITPYVGLDLYMKLGKYTYDGKSGGESHTGDMGVAPYVGLVANITPMFYLGGDIRLGFGEKIFGEKTPITITVKAGLNF